MNIKTTLERSEKRLENISDTPLLDVEILLSHVLNVDRSYLFAHPEKPIQEDKQKVFDALLDRRCQHEPMAYILENKEFWSLDLKVTPDVLIPRPETELLVETTLDLLSQAKAFRVADLGTGCGAVALALGVTCPQWKIVATDNSAKALKLAQANAKRLGLDNIQFLQTNWCQGLTHTPFHAIVANPPYIKEGDPHLIQGDVAYEPRLALEAGVDGLKDIRKIINDGKVHLLPDAWLLLEHGFEQGEEVRQLFKQHGYKNTITKQDLSGLDRVTIGQV